jgi:translation initiation factor 4B
MGRRKLDLLPRSSNNSVDATSSTSGQNRPNPFGDARPVDAAAREKEISDKIDKERAEWTASRPTRTVSNTPRTRGAPSSPTPNKTPLPPTSVTAPSSPTSNRFTSREVSRGFSFAAAASGGRPKDFDKNNTSTVAEEKPIEEKVAELAV